MRGDFVPRSAAWGRQREPDLVQQCGEKLLGSSCQADGKSVCAAGPGQAPPGSQRALLRTLGSTIC